MVASFEANPKEVEALNEALMHNCTCKPDDQYRCPGHAALVNDERFAKHFLFGRFLRRQLIESEWSTWSPRKLAD